MSDASRTEARAAVSLPAAHGIVLWWQRLGRLVRALAHYGRWRPRFAAFGWRSTLQSPDLVRGARGVRIGRRVAIRKGARIEVVAPDGEIAIGDLVSIHLYFHVGAALRIEIGDRVLIAGHVYVTDHDHALAEPGLPRGVERTLDAAPTIVEADCWLGEGCKILKGVRLGQGCVVGAGAVVTRSFPPYTIVAGIPARAIRHWDSCAHAWVRVEQPQA